MQNEVMPEQHHCQQSQAFSPPNIDKLNDGIVIIPIDKREI
jgi:hypothetical protein